MKLQIGKIKMEVIGNQILETRTKRYLLPILKAYGPIFIGKLNSVFKLACGLGDMVVERRGFKYEKHLFILLDSSVATKFFIVFLEWIRKQPYFEEDYVYGNIQKSRFHMIIVKVPDKFVTALKVFKEGRYSKMYSKEDVDLYFNNHPDTKRVLIRDANYKMEFVKKVNQDFNTSIDDFDIEDYELDYPVNPKDEYFGAELGRS